MMTDKAMEAVDDVDVDRDDLDGEDDDGGTSGDGDAGDGWRPFRPNPRPVEAEFRTGRTRMQFDMMKAAKPFEYLRTGSKLAKEPFKRECIARMTASDDYKDFLALRDELRSMVSSLDADMPAFRAKLTKLQAERQEVVAGPAKDMARRLVALDASIAELRRGVDERKAAIDVLQPVFKSRRQVALDELLQLATQLSPATEDRLKTEQATVFQGILTREAEALTLLAEITLALHHVRDSKMLTVAATKEIVAELIGGEVSLSGLSEPAGEPVAAAAG